MEARNKKSLQSGVSPAANAEHQAVQRFMLLEKVHRRHRPHRFTGWAEAVRWLLHRLASGQTPKRESQVVDLARFF